MITKKLCIKCNIEKDSLLFVSNTNSCKECMKEYKKNYRIKNIEKLRKSGIDYYYLNREDILKKRKEHYESNSDQKIEYQRQYSINNKEKVAKYKSEHTKKNKDKITKYKTTYQRNRRKTDPIFKLKSSISKLIRQSFKKKGLLKSNKTIEILGCSIEEFKNHLESKFTDNMNWSNHGYVWDIDHIIPLCTAISEEDVIRLNHYLNLQPLDSIINRNIKRGKVNFYSGNT